MESGELRVVNKAARQHWNFTRDNAKHLMKHMYDLKFAKEPQHMRGYSGYQVVQPSDQPIVPLSKVSVGLANINTESAEQMHMMSSGVQLNRRTVFDKDVASQSINAVQDSPSNNYVDATLDSRGALTNH